MYICFYNMNHIGDIYFMSLFMNIICQQNKDVKFLYYTINADIFLENNSNLSRIYPNDIIYSNQLVNGHPPENLLNNNVLKLLLDNKMENVGMKILNFNNNNILFVNTWCKSSILNHDEYDISSAIISYKNLISTINFNFNCSLSFVIDNPKQLIENKYNFIDNLKKDIKQIDEDTTFIFNFTPRSLPYNIEILNNFIRNLSVNNKIILSYYNHLFEGNKNIKFIDKDYGITPIPSCKNLLDIWDIAIKCKKIIILPSGGSWTFLHKLKEIKSDQIYMFNDTNYYKILNNCINTLTEENKNLINFFRF